jgi:hypothetical protein
MKTKLLGAATALALLGAAPASATTYNYFGLVTADVVFGFDTTTTTGTFDMTNGITNAALGAGAIFGFIPTHTSITLTNGAVTAWSLSAFAGGQGGYSISTTTSGDAFNLLPGGGRIASSGSSGPGVWSGPIPDAFSTTPLPGALPLFATGLGALGLIGWRRKRKAFA